MRLPGPGHEGKPDTGLDLIDSSLHIARGPALWPSKQGHSGLTSVPFWRREADARRRSASFWKPVAAHGGLDGVFFAWPGLGAEPAAENVGSIDDLVSLVAVEIQEPVAIVAQSMGGYVAIKLALAFPSLVKSLVLTVTSGGVPISDLGGRDWRAEYFAAFPNAANWIANSVADLSDRIPSIQAPTLLLWGDADPISPAAVGQRLSDLLPSSRLCVFSGADHDLARTHAETVAGEIRRHLVAAS